MKTLSKKKVLLFGSSYMAEEYLKVFKQLDVSVTVVGRNFQKASLLAKKYGFSGLGGGIDVLKSINPSEIDLVIIASSITSLKEISLACLKHRFKKILVEKPGALNIDELYEIKQNSSSNIMLKYACNRRMFPSVQELKKRIEAEGLEGLFFDFTEREKDLKNSSKSSLVLNKWGLGNSIHVIDTAFFLCGKPTKLNSEISGSWKEHPSGTTFTGSGLTSLCPFSYFATWNGGGRWNIEISTTKGRYKLSPLEELQFLPKNSFVWENITLNSESYKPGLSYIINSILSEKNNLILPDIDELIEDFKIINEICGYKND